MSEKERINELESMYITMREDYKAQLTAKDAEVERLKGIIKEFLKTDFEESYSQNYGQIFGCTQDCFDMLRQALGGEA